MSGFQNDPGTVQQEGGFGFENLFWAQSRTDGITAFASGGQASATLLTTMINRITTAANPGASVQLPPSRATLVGLELCIINASANTVQVFGSNGTTDSINGAASATGVPMMPNSVAYFLCTGAGTWVATGLGYGFATQQSAGFTTYSTQTGITASATQTAAGGTVITGTQAQVSTCAVAGNALTLPPAKPGMEITIVNNGANSAGVFGATTAQGGNGGGDTVNGSGSAFTLAVTTPVIFYCFVLGNWVTK